MVDHSKEGGISAVYIRVSSANQDAQMKESEKFVQANGIDSTNFRSTSAA